MERTGPFGRGFAANSPFFFFFKSETTTPSSCNKSCGAEKTLNSRGAPDRPEIPVYGLEPGMSPITKANVHLETVQVVISSSVLNSARCCKAHDRYKT